MARALRACLGRATLRAGTWPLNSTVKTPVNMGVTTGPFEAPHQKRTARPPRTVRGVPGV